MCSRSMGFQRTSRQTEAPSFCHSVEGEGDRSPLHMCSEPSLMEYSPRLGGVLTQVPNISSYWYDTI